MSLPKIAKFVSTEGMTLYIDMDRVESVNEHHNDPLITIIVTGSDTYKVQMEVDEVYKQWRSACGC